MLMFFFFFFLYKQNFINPWAVTAAPLTWPIIRIPALLATVQVTVFLHEILVYHNAYVSFPFTFLVVLCSCDLYSYRFFFKTHFGVLAFDQKSTKNKQRNQQAGTFLSVCPTVE